MRSHQELLYLGRDFFRYLGGRDYFRQSQGLGYYFQDERCYYNDLTGKADWNGARRDGLPLLYVAAADESIVWPITVLLFGLGSIDKYFLGAGDVYLRQVRSVVRWIAENPPPEGIFDNRWNLLYPKNEFYSNNSAMCQGLALSFTTRVVRYQLADPEDCSRLDRMLDSIYSGLNQPVEQGGTVLRNPDGVFLMEFCGKPHNVVLNGWIFAVFGLMDYQKHRRNPSADALLEETLASMESVLPRYSLPNGWSYYDQNKRLSSPFYHMLHIAQLDAMHRLTQRQVYRIYWERFLRGNSRRNQLRYMLVKIKDKLMDRDRYTSQQ